VPSMYGFTALCRSCRFAVCVMCVAECLRNWRKLVDNRPFSPLDYLNVENLNVTRHRLGLLQFLLQLG